MPICPHCNEAQGISWRARKGELVDATTFPRQWSYICRSCSRHYKLANQPFLHIGRRALLTIAVVYVLDKWYFHSLGLDDMSLRFKALFTGLMLAVLLQLERSIHTLKHEPRYSQ